MKGSAMQGLTSTAAENESFPIKSWLGQKPKAERRSWAWTVIRVLVSVLFSVMNYYYRHLFKNRALIYGHLLRTCTNLLWERQRNWESIHNPKKTHLPGDYIFLSGNMADFRVSWGLYFRGGIRHWNPLTGPHSPKQWRADYNPYLKIGKY